jgi:tetratricopeptide (TPR) repeat protein
MKIKVQPTRVCLSVALLLTLGVLPARARAASKFQIVAVEIQKLLPDVRAIEDAAERDGTWSLMVVALARMGNFEAALQMNSDIPNAKLKRKNHDEIWRITARRLAWQGNIAAATRSANRIQAEYSRADALLAVARAYLRAGDSNAARRVLQRLAPTVRATKSPYAISYLAYLFARVGDTEAARKLFAEARQSLTRKSRTPNVFEQDTDDDAQRAIVAYYQAKSGWSEAALATVGRKLNNLGLTKSVLVTRHEWRLLRDFADKLPTQQAISLLLELSGAQLKADDSVAARLFERGADAFFSVFGWTAKLSTRAADTNSAGGAGNRQRPANAGLGAFRTYFAIAQL